MSGSRLVGVVAVCAALAGCPSSPRFGDLRFGPRRFHLDEPVTVVELKSGMVVALVPDARTNLVSVDVRYKVGAAEDPEGLAGLAHLIEHLTFELRPEPGAPTLQAQLGEAALAHNAYTSHDHTHYWSVGLADRLDDLLELEARRMDPRCGQLDEAVFLRERDVVLEERAQRERYRFDDLESVGGVWGEGHPYAREIGSREVAEATRDEACRFLADHYAPNRAILVISGNLDAEEVLPRVAERFGAMARRSQGTRVAIPEAPLDGGRSEHSAATRTPRVVVSFAVPGDAQDDIGRLALEYVRGEVAWRARGKRRFQVQDVSMRGGRRAGLVQVTLAVPDEAQIDRAVDAVYEGIEALRWRDQLWGLEARRSTLRTELLHRLDSFWMRGHWVADRLHYERAKEPFASALQAIDGFAMRDLARWVETHLRRERSHVAIFRPATDASPPPAERIAVADTEHDLPLDHVAVDLAEAERALDVPASAERLVHDERLANGLRVVLAPVPGARLVDARLVFPVGDDARDRSERALARSAALMLHDDLSPDFTKYDRERLDWVFGLGTVVDAEVDERATTFRARGLALFADWHVWRLFWRLHAGIYPPDRRRTRDPDAEAERRRFLERMGVRHDDALVRALFGPDAVPSIQPVADRPTRAELDRFRDGRYVARGATLIVAGGFDVEEMRGAIVTLFGAWPDRETVARAEPLELRGPAAPRQIAIEDPQAVQLRISVAVGGLPAGDRAARAVLGEMLDTRLRRIRDGLGASYGVRSGYIERGDLAAVVIGGHIDPDRGDRAVAAILDIVAAIRDGGAETTADFVRARRLVLARALARTGSAEEVADDLEARVAADDSITDLDRDAAAIAGLTPEALADVAARDLSAASLVVVISGPGDSAHALFEASGFSADEIEDL